ncbi:unnamed protein product [Merluccius merluccius]
MHKQNQALCVLEGNYRDWNQTGYGLPPPYERGDVGKILPLALQYLTPTWVSVLGVGSFNPPAPRRVFPPPGAPRSAAPRLRGAWRT